MNFLSVSKRSFELLFSLRGRINRARLWAIAIPFWALFWIAFDWLDSTWGRGSTLPLSGIFLLAALTLCVRRLHDRDKSGWWLALLLVPVIGPAWIFVEVGLLPGVTGDNRYGDDPIRRYNDYLRVE